MKIEIGTYKNKAVTFDTVAAMNSHILAIGKSGSGKTVEMQKIMIEVARQGGTVIAFDLHQALAEDQIFWKYKKDFDVYSTEINAYENGISCNLLESLAHTDGTYEKAIDTIGAVTDVIGRQFRLGCRQRAVLRNAIVKVYETGRYEKEGFAAIAHTLSAMDDKTAASVLEKIYVLSEHNIFRAGDWPVQTGKINIFRLGKFDMATQEMVAEILLLYIWRLATVGRYQEMPVYVFVDECQNLQDGKNSVLAQILSEGRKFKLNLFLATQQFEKGTVSLVQQRFTQSDLIMYFQPDVYSVKRVARMIDPDKTAEWAVVLKGLKKGEFVASGELQVNDKEVTCPLKVSAYVKQSQTDTGKCREYEEVSQVVMFPIAEET